MGIKFPDLTSSPVSFFSYSPAALITRSKPWNSNAKPQVNHTENMLINLNDATEWILADGNRKPKNIASTFPMVPVVNLTPSLKMKQATFKTTLRSFIEHPKANPFVCEKIYDPTADENDEDNYLPIVSNPEPVRQPKNHTPTIKSMHPDDLSNDEIDSIISDFTYEFHSDSS